MDSFYLPVIIIFGIAGFIFQWRAQKFLIAATQYKTEGRMENVRLDPSVLYSNKGLTEEGIYYRRLAIRQYLFALLSIVGMTVLVFVGKGMGAFG